MSRKSMLISTKVPNIVGHLQSKLRSLLSDNSLLFKEVQPHSDYFSLAGDKIINIPDQENGRVVGMARLSIRDITYGISIVLKFNYGDKKTDHISISIYDSYDNTALKLFRAEWDSETKYNHAQPHWHIHKKEIPPIYSEDSITVFSPGNNESPFETSIDKIHFAMMATWDKNSECIYPVSRTELKNQLSWVEGVVKYIGVQLLFLQNKSVMH